MRDPISPPDPPLGDGAIVLRPWTQGDLEELVAAIDDPSISRWIPTIPNPYTADDARSFLAAAARWWQEGTSATFGIRDARSGELLGGIGLGVRAPRRVEVGYWIRRSARGRGVAVAALRLISRWAFDDLGVGRIALRADVENVASQRVAEKCGYEREGVLRRALERDGELSDGVIFSLLPGELR